MRYFTSKEEGQANFKSTFRDALVLLIVSLFFFTVSAIKQENRFFLLSFMFVVIVQVITTMVVIYIARQRRQLNHDLNDYADRENLFRQGADKLAERVYNALVAAAGENEKVNVYKDETVSPLVGHLGVFVEKPEGESVAVRRVTVVLPDANAADGKRTIAQFTINLETHSASLFVSWCSGFDAMKNLEEFETLLLPTIRFVRNFRFFNA